MDWVIVIFVIGCVLFLYFSWRSWKHLDKAMKYTNIAIEASYIAIKALHSDMDELEILNQQLDKLKRKNK